MAEADKALGEAIAALRKALRKQTAGLRKAEKALDALVVRGALERVEVLDQAVPALRDADLGPLGLTAQKNLVIAGLEPLHHRAEVAARSKLLAELSKAAAAQGVEMTRLTDRPLVVDLAPLQVELDLSTGKAQVLYARESVEEAELAPAEVMAARQRALDRIRDESLESPAFFDLLQRAYRTALVARGEVLGARVDLVDLLAPLALLRVDADQWRKTAPEKIAPYPRYLLAYQLRRLGRDRLLEKDGVRVELGTATGGSTRNKQDVLFVPTGGSEGQYHLSIRFTSR